MHCGCSKKQTGWVHFLWKLALYNFVSIIIIIVAFSLLSRLTCSAVRLSSVPPKLEKDIRDQKVEKGDQFKIKIPFSGSGPFDFKVKSNGRDLREGERIKISLFDDYLTLIVKGVHGPLRDLDTILNVTAYF